MITSYPTARARALAGMTVDSFLNEFLSRALASQQLEELTFGTTDGTYTVTINGVVVGTFAASGNTAAEIRDNIYDDIVASAAPVVATKVSTNKLLLEKADFGDAFTIAISTVSGYSKSQLVNQDQTAGFGLGLVADDMAPVSGQRCRLPRQATDISAKFLGISHGDTGLPYSGNGWPAGSMVSILRRGHIWVVTETAIAEQAQLFCRYAAGAGGSVLGAFRNDADTSTAGAVVGLKALEACSGAGLVPAEYIPNT
jgi:hypothetical protein